MSIEVFGSSSKPVQNTTDNAVVRREPAGATSQPVRSGGARADTVSLSGMSSRLSRVVASLPEVDSSRVAEVKQRLASGSYEVNPARIAGKMFAMERAFA